jgi:hypothetical protein
VPAADNSRANLRPPRRNGLHAVTSGTARGLLAAAVLTFSFICADDSVQAREPLAGDTERLKMIGFTVADLDREADFFVKVLQFEKVSDFRVVGSEYDRM